MEKVKLKIKQKIGRKPVPESCGDAAPRRSDIPKIYHINGSYKYEYFKRHLLSRHFSPERHVSLSKTLLWHLFPHGTTDRLLNS